MLHTCLWPLALHLFFNDAEAVTTVALGILVYVFLIFDIINNVSSAPPPDDLHFLSNELLRVPAPTLSEPSGALPRLP